MRGYIDNLQNTLDNGVVKTDRTGTGTVSVKGQSITFDLNAGFPLVTSKKAGIQDIYKENKWICSGDTSNRYLNKLGCKIWNGDGVKRWADDEDRLGPIYGAMWRRRPAAKIEYLWLEKEEARTKELLDLEQLRAATVPPDHLGLTLVEHLLANQNDQSQTLMCKYKTARIAYVMVFESFIKAHYSVDFRPKIDARWLNFEHFLNDFSKMAGNELVNTFPTGGVPNKTIVYRKRNYDEGVFDRFSVQFIPEEYSTYVDKANATAYANVSGAEARYLAPVFYIDQLAEVEKALAAKSDSRRIIIDGWEPSLTPVNGVPPDMQAGMGRQALPTCHTLYQFFVDPIEGSDRCKLSLVMYQRSQDMVLGKPYNIASCALLVHLLAKKHDLDLGTLTISGGDCHIYRNHIETLKKQMQEPLFQLPTLEIIGEVKDFDNLEDVKVVLHNYKHGPVYRYPVAV